MALANRAMWYVGVTGLAAGLLLYACRAQRGAPRAREELSAISREGELD